MRRPRLALAALAFALVVVASYAGQRLWDSIDEPPLGTVLRQVTIPYYWRVGTAALHGLIAGVAAATAATPARAEAWLARAGWLVPLVVVPAALAMALVP
jgi:hypothetical protein